MTRTARTLTALVLVALVASMVPLAAALKKEEKSKFKMGGPLGKMMGMFMGRQMREGVVSTIAIKGDRKLTRSGDTGRLVDLAEEKVYDIDFKKKTYSVLTFEQVRQKMLETQQKMKEQQAKMEAERAKHPDQKAPEYDYEVSSKATGEAKEINGFQTKQVITTITMKPKGQSLEQGGGMVMTMDQWLTPKVPGTQEEIDFEMKYLKKIGMADMVQEMAAAVAMYPGIMEAAKRAKIEGDKLDGTPIYAVSTFDLVASAEQQKEQDKQQAEADSGGGGGLGGLLARKMMKKKKTDDAATDGSNASASKGPSLMTTTMEVLSLSNDAADADVALPEGFKQKNPD
jgi:hypothetical protein